MSHIARRYLGYNDGYSMPSINNMVNNKGAFKHPETKEKHLSVVREYCHRALGIDLMALQAPLKFYEMPKDRVRELNGLIKTALTGDHNRLKGELALLFFKDFKYSEPIGGFINERSDFVGVWQVVHYALPSRKDKNTGNIVRGFLLCIDNQPISQYEVRAWIISKRGFFEGTCHCKNGYGFLQLHEKYRLDKQDRDSSEKYVKKFRNMESVFYIFYLGGLNLTQVDRAGYLLTGQRLIGVGMGMEIKKEYQGKYPIGAAKACAYRLSDESAELREYGDFYLGEEIVEELRSKWCFMKDEDELLDWMNKADDERAKEYADIWKTKDIGGILGRDMPVIKASHEELKALTEENKKT